jgi:hypothetical protein
MPAVDPHWTSYLTAFATPILALVAGSIAWQQMQTAKAKLKLDLFERRLVVYEGVREYLAVIMRTGVTTPEAERAFLESIHGSKWLFETKLISYLNETLWGRACDLGCLQSELDGMPSEEERSKKIQARADLKQWFLKQHKELEGWFLPYLEFRKWH